MKAVARRPEDRFSTVAEFLAAVDDEIRRLGLRVPGLEAAGVIATGDGLTIPVGQTTGGLDSEGGQTVTAETGTGPGAQLDVFAMPVAAAIWGAALAVGFAVGWFVL